MSVTAQQTTKLYSQGWFRLPKFHSSEVTCAPFSDSSMKENSLVLNKDLLCITYLDVGQLYASAIKHSFVRLTPAIESTVPAKEVHKPLHNSS